MKEKATSKISFVTKLTLDSGHVARHITDSLGKDDLVEFVLQICNTLSEERRDEVSVELLRYLTGSSHDRLLNRTTLTRVNLLKALGEAEYAIAQLEKELEECRDQIELD